MTGVPMPFGRRGAMDAALRRLQPSDDVLELTGPLPALPNDTPSVVFTHSLDRSAQLAIEHANRPRARASPR